MNELMLLNGEKFNEEEVQVFNEKYLAVMKSIADLSKQKKPLKTRKRK